MFHVERAFVQGKAMVKLPVGGLGNTIKFRNRTSLMLKRNFSARNLMNQRRKTEQMVRQANVGQHTTAVKWAVLTGVTIVLGTMILKSQSKHGAFEKDEDNDEEKQKSRVQIFDNDWLFFCYSTLPLNAMSRLWGQVNSLDLPTWMRPWGFKCFSYMFGVKLDEMEDPDLKHYSNLSEFFYRRIKDEVRPICADKNVLVCPSDGKVLQIGIIDSETGEIEQVKGLTYSVRDFLGTHSHPSTARSQSSLDLTAHEEKHREFAELNNFKLTDDDGNKSDHYIEIKEEGDKTVEESKPTISKTVTLLSELSLSNAVYTRPYNEPRDTQLYFAVIYLAPGDYHHFHSPADWVCKIRRHFPGDLFSVAPYFQRNFPNLFILNERVALLGNWKHGFFSMTPVGATNVGSIKLNFDKELKTNLKRNKHNASHACYEATYENASKILGGLPLTKGEEMGGFMLGSTVVLCFEAPKTFQFKVKSGEKVEMGQELGSFAQ